MTAVAIGLFFMFQVSLAEYNKAVDRSECEVDEYSIDCAKPKPRLLANVDK